MELMPVASIAKHGAASVVIIKRDEVLVITTHGKKQKFQLIGGKARANELPVVTVLRECAEETGLFLNPAVLESLGLVDYHKNGKLLRHSFFLYRVDDSMEPKSQGLVWVPLSKLRSGKRFHWRGYKLAIRKAEEQLLQKLEN